MNKILKKLVFFKFSGKKINIKISEEIWYVWKNVHAWINSRWVQVGSGSDFQNYDFQDPDPAENGPDPQPWYSKIATIFWKWRSIEYKLAGNYFLWIEWHLHLSVKILHEKSGSGSVKNVSESVTLVVVSVSEQHAFYANPNPVFKCRFRFKNSNRTLCQRNKK